MQAGDRSTPDETLRAGYRSIRHVSPPESPWPGTLTRTPDGESCVLVDAAALGDDWYGWCAEEGGHVLAPLDVVRRPDGHDVALPVCSERVDAFLARRVSDRDDLDGLDDGQAVTLAVSLLRGAAEVARDPRGDPPVGEWWLTDAGRPVLATGMAGRATSEVLGSLAAAVDGRIGRAITDAAAAAADPRTLLRDIDECESALFAAAEPRPLATNVFISLHGSGAPVRGATQEPEATPAPRWADALARHVDADLTALVSDTVTRVWRRMRHPRPGSRKRPWIIAAGLAGGVLGLGLLWPSGGGPATAEGSIPAATPSAALVEPAEAVPSVSPDPVQDSGAAGAGAQKGETGGDVDWETAAAGLLTRRATCGGQPGCLADLVEDPTRTFPSGVTDRPDVRITLLDEFGGAAVLRVEDPTDVTAPAQLVVVVRAQERLLLRDIHDVAEKKT